MKKYLFIVFGILLLSPICSSASGINYGRILSQTKDTILLRYGNTENPTYYNCIISNLSCIDLGKNTPEQTTAETIQTDLKPFTFSTSSTWKKNIHTRNFFLKNNKTGKIYKRSYKVSFWDLIGEEGMLSSFSPDGKKLVYLDDESGYPTLYQLDLSTLKGNTFKGKKIFTESFTTSSFILTSQNDLYFVSNKKNAYEWNLYKYNFTTKEISLIATNASYAFRIRKFDNGFVFFVVKGSSSYPVFYDEQTNTIKNFTGININETVSTINRKEISFGGNMHGALLTPENFNNDTQHTLLIWLHGGPYRQTALAYHPYASYAVYDLILDELAKNNVMVLKLDYRGSYGYGKKFAEAIKENVGKGDVADVETALTSIKKDFKIGDTYLMGNSYGGYLALRSIVAYPKQFTGAISINGVTDWASMLSNLNNSIFNVDFNGKPSKKNKKIYNKASIISRIPNLDNQKIVLIQAQADKTVPPAQADLLYSELKNQNKNVEFYPYADEDHVFKKNSSINGICKNVFTTLSLPIENNCNFE
ncbi:MAG: prolyl oligopeptidase family serine peptidase [Candidatus Nomurabacteria bacterium]|nr:prolyl oligopeptidase family serine peptidase [Candidatus Nomurabacteria bacterium]